MKDRKTLVFVGAILAVAAGILGASYSSALPQFIANIGSTESNELNVLGHVTTVIKGPDGVVKEYIQSDNIIQIDGKSCAAQQLFDNDATTICSLEGGNDGFNFIALSNGTGTPTDDQGNALPMTGVNTVNASAKGAVTFTAATAGNGAEVEIEKEFSFDANNATTIRQSGLCDSDQLTPACNNMFAAQELTGGGVPVNSGDTLTVTWTITVG